MESKKQLIDKMLIDFDEVDISGCTDVDDIIAAVEDLIDKQPTVDAVEVVRCKDCPWYKPAHFRADDGTEIPWDGVFRIGEDRSDGIYIGGKCKHDRNTAYGQKDMAFRSPDDFCSYGERRTDETKVD